MKKLILSLTALCCTGMMNSQITLLDENFDSFPNFELTFGTWLTLDFDMLTTYTGGAPANAPSPPWPNAGAAMAFQIFNPSVAMVSNQASPTVADPENRNFDPHSGTKYAASWAGSPNFPGDANLDYLVSPAIVLGGSGNSLSLWVKSLSNTYGLEQYRVAVYVGTGTPSSPTDFTVISGANTLSAPYPNWEQKTYNLDAYSNQSIRVAVINQSEDAYMFMVDDIKLTATTLGTGETATSKSFSLFPNPTKGTFSIKSADKVAGIRVYDSSGKLVFENRNSNKGDIGEQPSGVYYVNINFADGTIKIEKLIKE